MVDYVKYLTNNLFNNEAFADLLNAKGVEAKAVAGGVELDRTAFNNINNCDLPHWMYMNKKFINSEYHTIKVSKEA